MSDFLSGFEDWTKAFDGWTDVSISELHGIMTAIVCVCTPPTKEQWVGLLAELSFALPDDEALVLLSEYGQDVFYALQDKDDAFCFEPLLPDEEHGLFDRLNALKDWAGGFISGIGMADIALQADEYELLGDLSKIAALRLPVHKSDNGLDFLGLYADDELADDELSSHSLQEDLGELTNLEQASEEQYWHLYEFVRMVPVVFSVRNKKSVMNLALIKGLDVGRKTASELANSKLPLVFDATTQKQ